MTRHYPLLKDYFKAVARDMVIRGAFQHRAGQPVDRILKMEGWAILKEVEEDLARMFMEMGVASANAIEAFVQRRLERGLDAGRDMVEGWIKDLFGGRRH